MVCSTGGQKEGSEKQMRHSGVFHSLVSWVEISLGTEPRTRELESFKGIIFIAVFFFSLRYKLIFI